MDDEQIRNRDKPREPTKTSKATGTRELGGRLRSAERLRVRPTIRQGQDRGRRRLGRNRLRLAPPSRNRRVRGGSNQISRSRRSSFSRLPDPERELPER